MPRRKIVSFRMTDEEHGVIKAEAARLRLSVSEFLVRSALRASTRRLQPVTARHPAWKELAESMAGVHQAVDHLARDLSVPGVEKPPCFEAFLMGDG